MMNSLYIHFPFCRHLCNYCDFYKNKLVSVDQIQSFQEKLLAEVQLNEEFLETNSSSLGKLSTLYIGGGTPSLWGLNGAEFIEKNILKRYGVVKDLEFTIEVDPDSWSEEEIKSWIKIGVTRFSIGAQSFDPFFIAKMDRQHTKDQIIELLSFLQEIKANYSVDLMLGLPSSENNSRDIEKEIKEFIKYEPSHFSVYILKTRKNYPHNSSLPSEDYIEKEYLNTVDCLVEHNYSQYEVSNFSKDGCESRHNLKYWACESVAALGSNATGLINKGDIALRYQWKSASQGMKQERLNAEEFLLEKVYMGLRSKLGFDFKNLDKGLMSDLYRKWDSLKYIKTKDLSHITLTAKGYLMLDSIIDDLFVRRVL